jgi:hypothetical protein
MRLVETRLLVEASSGGGKSVTLREILEKTFGHVPHIVLDVEGEFSTLREKYDYILAGKGGDIPADVRTAQMLARKVKELNASVIIDLYEMKPSERHRYYRLFLEALLDLPKDLWSPCILVMDEGHIFCPEKGAGTSEASEAVIDILSRGRKRGIGGILATQRLSKLSKDAAAECQNKIIGLANIDIDRERGARELGFTRKEDILTLRDMEAGEFYAIGPALCKNVLKTKINMPKTSHPKIGKRTIKAPVATNKVRGLLDKLKDLPREVEAELKTTADFKLKIKELEAKLRAVPVAKPVADLSEGELKRLRAEYQKELNRLTAEFDKRRIGEMTQAFRKIQQGIHDAIEGVAKEYSGKTEAPVITITPNVFSLKPATKEAIVEMAKAVAKNRSLQGVIVVNEEKPLGPKEKDILGFLATQPGRYFKKHQIGVMARMAWKGGSFGTYISKLRTLGLIEGYNELRITELGQQRASELGIKQAVSTKDALEAWLDKLGGGAKKIYEVILSRPDGNFTKEELGELANMEPKGGSFGTYLSQLSTLGLIVKDGAMIKLNPDIRG